VLCRSFATQEELDAQYDLENTVEDISLYADLYAKESEKVRAELEHHLDVSFGPTLAKHLDLYPALGVEQPAPVLVYCTAATGGRGRARSSASSPEIRLREAWRPSWSTTPSDSR
jgi:arylformamidase